MNRFVTYRKEGDSIAYAASEQQYNESSEVRDAVNEAEHCVWQFAVDAKQALLQHKSKLAAHNYRRNQGLGEQETY